MPKLKHILIPIDGSAASAKAAKAGIEFALQLGARITVYCAVDPVPYGFYAHGAPADEPAMAALERRASRWWKWPSRTRAFRPLRASANATPSSWLRMAGEA